MTLVCPRLWVTRERLATCVPLPLPTSLPFQTASSSWLFPSPAQERDLKSSLPAVPLRNLTSIFCLSARKPAPKPHPHSPKSPLIVTQLPEGLLTLQGLRFLTTYLLPKQTVLPLQPSVRSPSTPALQVPRNLSSTVTAITVTDSHLTALWGRRSSSFSAPQPGALLSPSPLSPLLLTALWGPRSSFSAPRLALSYAPSPLSPLRDVALLSGAGLQYTADSYPILRCFAPSSSSLAETAPNVLILSSVLSVCLPGWKSAWTFPAPPVH